MLASATSRGGGPREQNLLGIAAYRAGDAAAALEAFSQAAEGGVEAGRQNMVTVLNALNLQEAAQKALKAYAKGRKGGMLLAGRARAKGAEQ